MAYRFRRLTTTISVVMLQRVEPTSTGVRADSVESFVLKEYWGDRDTAMAMLDWLRGEFIGQPVAKFNAFVEPAISI